MNTNGHAVDPSRLAGLFRGTSVPIQMLILGWRWAWHAKANVSPRSDGLIPTQHSPGTSHPSPRTTFPNLSLERSYLTTEWS